MKQFQTPLKITRSYFHGSSNIQNHNHSKTKTESQTHSKDQDYGKKGLAPNPKKHKTPIY